MRAGSHSTLSFVLAAALVAGLWMTPSLGAQRDGGGAAAAPPAVPQGGGAQGRGAPGRGRANADLPPPGPAPKLANGKPDLSGLWANPYTANMAGGRGGAVDPKTKEALQFARKGERFEKAPRDGANGVKTFDLPYTELGLKRWLEYDPVTNGDYTGNCMPFGMSRSINSPHGVQIVQNTDALAFLFEQNTWHHWVPTNPAFKWPADLPPSWTGTSTGRWDGDTLIIETTNFNGYTKLDTAGHPHSSSLMLVNTFERINARTIRHTVTVRDPKMYTQEWMNVREWNTKPATQVLMEYSCDEGNLRGVLEGSIKVWKAPDEVD